MKVRGDFIEHDGGLLSSKLLDFVPGANFQVLQIISIIIIKRGINIILYTYISFLHLSLQVYLYLLELPFFLFLYLLRPSPKAKWVAVFFCRNRAQI